MEKKELTLSERYWKHEAGYMVDALLECGDEFILDPKYADQVFYEIAHEIMADDELWQQIDTAIVDAFFRHPLVAVKRTFKVVLCDNQNNPISDEMEVDAYNEGEAMELAWDNFMDNYHCEVIGVED